MERESKDKNKGKTDTSKNSEKVTSKEKPPGKEPDALHLSGSLFAAPYAAGGHEPPPERFASLLNSPAFSHPANSTIRNNTFLHMQKTFGNGFVQRMVENSSIKTLSPEGGIQTKLKVGRPGDRYEQEADRVAERVMRMPDYEIQPKPTRRAPSPTCREDEFHQRQVDNEESELLPAKPLLGPVSPEVRRQPEGIGGGGVESPDFGVTLDVLDPIRGSQIHLFGQSVSISGIEDIIAVLRDKLAPTPGTPARIPVGTIPGLSESDITRVTCQILPSLCVPSPPAHSMPRLHMPRLEYYDHRIIDRFETNDSAVPDSGIASLERTASEMKNNPAIVTDVGGHTDSHGTAEYNERLSLERARSVEQFLRDNGVSDEQILYVYGLGLTRPAAPGDRLNPDAAAQNRRVELDMRRMVFEVTIPSDFRLQLPELGQVMRKPVKETERQPERENVVRQVSVAFDRAPEVASDTESGINSLKGGGSPLSESTRAFFEPRMGGRDLSGVRVHTDTRAAKSARALNASAFTHGRDIYFGEGRYQPESTDGRRLIAHELTHVGQQERGGSYDIGSPSSDLSRQRQTVTNSVIRAKYGPPDLQRQIDDTTEITEEGVDLATRLQQEVDEWASAVEEFEEPLEAAYALRVVLLMQFSGPETLTDENELEDFIDNCTFTALSEYDTLERLGELALIVTKAFPEIWAGKVFEALYVNVDLDEMYDKTFSTWERVQGIAGLTPDFIFSHGLPVKFSKALGLTQFELELMHTRLNSEHIVKDFALAGARYAKSYWIYTFFFMWNQIANGVAETVETGEHVVDYNEYIDFLEARRAGIDTLSERLANAWDEGAFYELENEVFDLTNVAFLVSLGATFMSFGSLFVHWQRAKELFDETLVATDELVRGESESERIMRALSWAYENGYFADAGEQIWQNILEHGWEILGLAILFILVQFIPILNVAVDVAVIIYSGIDALEALAELYDAFVRVANAGSTVELQRESARLANLLLGDGLRIFLDILAITVSVRAIRTRVVRIKAENPALAEEEALSQALREAEPAERAAAETLTEGQAFLLRHGNSELAQWALRAARGGADEAEVILNRVLSEVETSKAVQRSLAPAPGGKAAAGVEGGTTKISGWGTAGSAEDAIVEEVMNMSRRIGHDLRRAGGADQGVPGKFQASHAEKKLSIVEPNKPIGVTGQAVCSDCQGYFQALARYTGKTQVVCNGVNVWVFTPERTIVLPR